MRELTLNKIAKDSIRGSFFNNGHFSDFLSDRLQILTIKECTWCPENKHDNGYIDHSKLITAQLHNLGLLDSHQASELSKIHHGVLTEIGMCLLEGMSAKEISEIIDRDNDFLENEDLGKSDVMYALNPLN